MLRRYTLDARAFVLVSNLGLAFIAHYNAPAMYESLADRSPQKFAKVVTGSFAVLSLLYLLCMGFGYATFGDKAAANVLNNYAEATRSRCASPPPPHSPSPPPLTISQPPSVLGRVATGFSILFGFPLAMVGLRYSVVGRCESLADDATTALPPSVCSALLAVADDSNRFMLVVSMLAVITFVAVTCTDIGVIVGVSGALLGALIVYIIPPLLYKGARDDAPQAIQALVPLGAFLGVLGVYYSLK